MFELVLEIPAIESKNWLLHRHYTRHEYKTCKILINQELTKSNGHNEYANYLKVSRIFISMYRSIFNIQILILKFLFPYFP